MRRLFQATLQATLRASLLLMLLAAPTAAQPEAWDLPAGMPIDVDLWQADVQLVLASGATPRLSARAFVADAAGGLVATTGPTIELRENDSRLEVVRIAPDEAVRLGVELRLELDRPILIAGRELEVLVQGPPLDLEAMARRRELARQSNVTAPAPEWTAVTLDLEQSRADLFGLSGARLYGYESYIVSQQSTNHLAVELDGGAIEIERHRGELELRARGDGVSIVRDANGIFELESEGGKLELENTTGRLEAHSRDSEVQVSDWSGEAVMTTIGGVLEMLYSRPEAQRLELAADNTEVTLEGIETGEVKIGQRGGILRLRDIAADVKLEARSQARLELEMLAGSVMAIFEESEIRARSVGRLEVDLQVSTLWLAGAESLDARLRGSQIEGSEVSTLGAMLLTDSTGRLGLGVGNHGTVELRDGSRATIELATPCFVVPPPGVRFEEHPGLQVWGCTLGADTRTGSAGEAGPRSLFTAVVEDGSELSVQGF